MMDFGWMKQRREALHLSQHEVSRRTGFRQTTLSMIETGHTKDPRISVILKLMEVLEMGYEDFFRQCGVHTPQKKDGGRYARR